MLLVEKIYLPLVNDITKKLLLSFLGSILIALSSQVIIPMYPVPLTMQTFCVLSLGMALGSKYGSLSVMMYLLMGVLGLPVFSLNVGLSALFGPTGGYLLGFIFASYVVGLLAERNWDKTLLKAFFAMLIGNVVIYIFGLTQLGLVIGWSSTLLELGLYPFVFGDLVKVGIASALFPMLWKKLRK